MKPSHEFAAGRGTGLVSGMGVRSGTAVVGGVAALMATGSVLAGGSGFSVEPAWPQVINGSSPDGGLLVNVDDDPELEYVRVIGSANVGCELLAYNQDGSLAPGFPAFATDGPFSPPAFGDIDGDGEGEIVFTTFRFGIGGDLYAFNLDGSLVSGFPQDLGGTLKGPALGDIDGDGDLEIALTVNGPVGFGQTYVLQGDGSVMPGFPRMLDEVAGAGCSIGDLDGDGTMEVVTMSYTSLYVFRANGDDHPGFPAFPGGAHTFNYNNASLADLDGDGSKEIITATTRFDVPDGAVWVWNEDGSQRSGWPQPTLWGNIIPPSVADIDGDGLLDIAIGDVVISPEPTVNQLYAWDRNGNFLSGFPVPNIDALHAQIMIADIDGDSNVELICDANLGGSDLYAYNHDGTPVAGWPIDVMGSSFQQSPVIGDMNGDGLLEIAGGGNLIQQNQTALYIWSSAFAYNEALAPVRMYQYNERRDGVVPGQESCDEDFDNDGAVGPSDLAALLGTWGKCPGCEQDLDGDGVVGSADLAALLAAWGDC